MTWLVGIVGAKAARWIAIGGGVLVALLLVFVIGRCSGGDYEDDYKAQIEQSNRSSDAVTAAAKDAIKALDGRTATEDAIDEVVAEAVKGIDDAETIDQVYAIVTANVCQHQANRNDPACRPGEKK